MSVGAAVVIGVIGGVLVLLVAEVVFHRAQIRWAETEARDLRHRLDRLELKLYREGGGDAGR